MHGMGEDCAALFCFFLSVRSEQLLQRTGKPAFLRASTLREIWNSPAYRGFRTSLLGEIPPAPCQNCGLRWSL
jgi:hypothetical protein